MTYYVLAIRKNGRWAPEVCSSIERRIKLLREDHIAQGVEETDIEIVRAPFNDTLTVYAAVEFLNEPPTEARVQA